MAFTPIKIPTTKEPIILTTNPNAVTHRLVAVEDYARQERIMVKVLHFLDAGDPIEDSGACLYCEHHLMTPGTGKSEELKPHASDCPYGLLKEALKPSHREPPTVADLINMQ